MISYLASPYSHSDISIQEQRFKAVCVIAAKLIVRGKHIFSPIAHSHPIVITGLLKTDWGTWEIYDKLMMDASGELLVIMFDGWKDSTGVKMEIAYMQSRNKPIFYLDPKDYG